MTCKKFKVLLYCRDPISHAAQLQTISYPLRDHLSGLAGIPPRQGLCIRIVEGINCGFRLGFDCSRFLRPARRNMSSTKDGEAVETYLAGEVPAGTIIGSLSSSTTSKVKVQINRLG